MNLENFCFCKIFITIIISIKNYFFGIVSKIFPAYTKLYILFYIFWSKDMPHAKAEQKGPSGPVSEVAPPVTSSSVSAGGQLNQQQPQHSSTSTTSTSVVVSSTSNSPGLSHQKPSSADGSGALSPSSGPSVSKAGQSPPSSTASPAVHSGRGGRGSDSNAGRNWLSILLKNRSEPKFNV